MGDGVLLPDEIVASSELLKVSKERGKFPRHRQAPWLS